MNEENKIILYQDDNEITRLSVRFADEDLCQSQIFIGRDILYYATKYQPTCAIYIKMAN